MAFDARRANRRVDAAHFSCGVAGHDHARDGAEARQREVDLGRRRVSSDECEGEPVKWIEVVAFNDQSGVPAFFATPPRGELEFSSFLKFP